MEVESHLNFFRQIVELPLHPLLREHDCVHLLLQAVAQDGRGVLALLLVLENDNRAREARKLFTIPSPVQNAICQVSQRLNSLIHIQMI